MDNQNRARASYAHYGEDRRQNVLPSISSRLHYNTNNTNESEDIRQISPGSQHFGQAGAISHAAYDPVHDAYDLPHTTTSQASDFQGSFPSESFHRGDRSSIHTYGAPRRYENTSLPPLQPTHHGQLQHSPALETDTSPFRSNQRTHSPSHGLHSFQVHPQAQAGSSSSSAPIHGMTQPARAQVESAPYMSLPPLSIPAQASSSSGEGKGGSKRIVMACHQCRGRKIRCDATRPACTNCVRRREECRYDAKPKRRGPDKVPGSRMRSCKSRKQAFEDASSTGPSS